MLLAPRPLFKATQSVRYVVYGPPSVRISFAEKCFHGVLMTAVFMACPCYITYMIPIWRDRNLGK